MTQRPRLGVDAGDVGEEAVLGEIDFGDVDEVGAVGFVVAAEGGGGGEPAGVAAHDDVDFDALEGAVVGVVALVGEGDEAGGAAVAGAVVGGAEVVVDGFGDVVDVEFDAVLDGHFGGDAGGVGGVVAADVEEVFDVIAFEGLEDFLAVGLVGLVAGGAEGGGGGLGDAFEEVEGEVVEGDEFVLDDAADAMAAPRILPILGAALGPGAFWAAERASMAPTRDWLMTAVGPPD